MHMEGAVSFAWSELALLETSHNFLEVVFHPGGNANAGLFSEKLNLKLFVRNSLRNGE